MKKLENGSDPVYMSVVARTEILHQPYLVSTALGNQAKQLLDSFGFLTYVDLSAEIADLAAELSSKSGPKLKNIDSVHLDSALHVKATDFWTNDRDLASISIEGLNIKLLSDVT